MQRNTGAPTASCELTLAAVFEGAALLSILQGPVAVAFPDHRYASVVGLLYYSSRSLLPRSRSL